MKKIYSLFLLAAAFLPSVSAETLDVYADATGASTYLPINIYYCSNNIHTQMIYPASELEAMKGKVIEKLTFTVTRVGAGVWNSPKVDIKMGTTDQTVYGTDAKYITDGLVDAATLTDISWATSLTAPFTWEITLDKPYTYTGDNLVIDFANVKGTGPRNWTFQGATQDDYTGLSMTSAARREKFLPSVKFEYTSAADASASLSASGLQFPMQFVGDDATSTIKLSNTGTTALSGVVSLSGDAFAVEPAAIESLEAGESIDLVVKFVAAQQGNYAETLTVALGDDIELTAAVKGIAVEGPEDIRVLFDKSGYDTTLPAEWTGFALETLTESGEFSDSTTDYDSFGSGYNFESVTIDGDAAIAWNHANPVYFSELYTRAYYLVSPQAGGEFTLGAAYTDIEAVGCYVKAFTVSEDATNGFTLGEEIPLTWSSTPAQNVWGFASATAPSSAYVALQLKYAALGFFASEKVANGVDAIVVNGQDNAPVEYYTLQGIKVTNPSTGIYLRRQGSKVDKVAIK